VTSVYVSDTPPGSPAANALWWNSTDGQLYVYYQDVNSSQWVIAVPQPDTKTLKNYTDSVNQNTIRNGLFDIWQRGTSFTLPATGTYYYTADGWMVSQAGQVGVISAVANPRLGTGGKSRAAMQIAGNTSNTGNYFLQRIESLEAAKLAGQICTLQFWLYNNSGASITPTFNTAYANAQDNWSASTNDIGSTNLQACPSGTSTLCSYSFLASGNAGNGYQVNVVLGALNATTKTVIISEVALMPTPTLTAGLQSAPPVPVFRDAAQELEYSQRYYYVLPTTPGSFACPATGGYNAYFNYPFKRTMRIAPTWQLGTIAASSLVSSSSTLSITPDFHNVQIVGSAAGNVIWSMNGCTYSAEL
jgi:hypothetical protein